jgi:Pyridoxamine 5'-phosphate oxidase
MVMATWQEFEKEAPRLAAAVRARFEAQRHHVLATLRKDGSPRVSGTEVRIRDGELTLGSMPGAVKAKDLQRDARFALHANPGDGSMDGGDAKVAGRAVEITEPAELEAHREPETPPGPSHAFRLDLEEAVLTSVEDEERLLIQLWRPGGGGREIRRT